MVLYAGGDNQAFRRLFARVAPRLRAFFLRSFGDVTVADDLTQATFLKLHGARASYRTGSPLSPWLFTIAASVRRDELRRRYGLPRLVAPEELEKFEADLLEVPPPESKASPSPHADAVRKAIERLPESQRVVVQLHQFGEMTFEQIAKTLRTTPGAVRVRASRAYERLRAELRRYIQVR